jgi:hypothetical protein
MSITTAGVLWDTLTAYPSRAFASTRVQPWLFGEVRVAHTFSFLCCPIMCIYTKSASCDFH